MEFLERAASHWDEMATRSDASLILRWWESAALRHLVDENWVRATGCENAGAFIRRVTGRTTLGLGLSIGCGTAEDEILLLEQGVLERLILCDISNEQLDRAEAFAKERGIDPNRLLRVNHIDLGAPYQEQLDLIYWRQSLHHMFDTRSTLTWCANNLTREGAIFCNDACPPNYMQWDKKVLDWVELYRSSLPTSYLRSPFTHGEYLPCRPTPPGIDYWKSIDPTECADSANIIPAIRDLAPGAHIAFLGGCIYGLALEDIISNFSSDSESDKALLANAMILDQYMANSGMNFYFASVIKRSDFL